nr:DUF3089 domain-containing protein [Pseudodesulfovibrio sp.]
MPRTNPTDAVVPRSPVYDQTHDWLVLPKNPDAHPVDVFWVYPTILSDDSRWLMDLDDAKLRQAAIMTVTTQASVFEGQANIYAPAYRQTNIASLYTKGDTTLIRQTANQDVEEAFKYYLENYNNGRPFILAGHSQGSEHLVKIATKLWGTSPKHNRLIAAYTLGWSVTPDDIKENPAIRVCQSEDQTGCFIAYNSIAPGKQESIEGLTRGKSYVVNPLTWKADSVFAPASLNLGSVFFDENGSATRYENFATAQGINSGLEVITAKPSILAPLTGLGAGVYHSSDYALFYENIKENIALRIKKFINKPKARFAILSDPHYCNASLIDDGEAFKRDLITDPKLFRESDAIMTAAVDAIIAANVDFVLVAGDMSKDGELVNHRAMATHFNRLNKAGISTWVTTGNHDINNNDAKQYHGDSTHPVPTVTPDEFTKIYAKHGYGKALERDSNSLSYVCEPVPGIQFIVIDSCIYVKSLDRDNPVNPETAGEISAETEAWVIKHIHKAKAEGKIVYGMMHHSILQHFSAQQKMFPKFIVKDFDRLSKTVAEAGLEVMFTGHFHATDIVTKSWTDKNGTHSLTDVQTGALASYPVPFRLCTVNANGSLDITTERVERIDYTVDSHNFMDAGKPTFQDYAKDYGTEGLKKLGKVVYSNNFNAEEAKILGDFFAESLMVHYEGDENISEEARRRLEVGMKISKDVAQDFLSLQTDLYPADNILKTQSLFTVTPNSTYNKESCEVTIKGNVLGDGRDITNVTIVGVPASIIRQTNSSVVVTPGTGVTGTGHIEIYSTSKGMTKIKGAFTYTESKLQSESGSGIKASSIE